MFHYARRALWATRRRLLGTAVAVMLGSALIAGTFVSTDTIIERIDGADTGPGRPVDLIVVDRRSPSTGTADDDIAWIPDLLTSGRLTPLPADLVDRLGSLDGVAAATGVVLAPVEILGGDGRAVTSRAAPVARSVDATYGPHLTDGRLPTGDDEVILDEATAASNHLAEGDRVSVVLPDGRIRELTLVGVVRDTEPAGNLLVGLAPDGATGLLGPSARYGSIEIQAAPGVTGEQLRSTVEAALTAEQGTISGPALWDWQRREAARFVGILRGAISVAGVIALLFGTFVIRNTFSIVLASRLRELALLRCLGATRRQVRRLVLVEAGVLGLVASTAGLVVGVALAALLGLLIDAGDVLAVPVTGAAPVVAARTVAAALTVGTLTAVLAARGAARRATAVAPVAALRQDVNGVAAGESRLRASAGALLLLCGGVVVAVTEATGADPAVMLPGALLLVLGVIVAGPLLARSSAAVIGPLLARARGVSGDLARVNSSRHPRRTSGAVVPYALGLLLVVAFSVFTADVLGPPAAAFDANARADVFVTPITHRGRLSADTRLDASTVDTLRATDGLAAVVDLRTSADYAVAGGTRISVTGVDAAALAEVAGITVVEGSLTDVHDGAVAVSADAARDHGLELGSLLDVGTPTGPTRLVVRAVYRRPVASDLSNELASVEVPYGELIVSPADHERATGRTGADLILVAAADGVDARVARDAVERALRDHPTVVVRSRREVWRDGTASLLVAFRFYQGLIGLMVLVAILGIGNVLALSVAERRREIGLLRVLGLDRYQTRSMVRLETVVTVATATIIGVPLGALLGHIFAAVQDIPSTHPVRAPLLTLAAATAVVLAVSDRPARRAGRIAALVAVTSED